MIECWNDFDIILVTAKNKGTYLLEYRNMHLDENAKKKRIKNETAKKTKTQKNAKIEDAYFQKQRRKKQNATLEERCKLRSGEYCVSIS